jgi:hypothetical protein
MYVAGCTHLAFLPSSTGPRAEFQDDNILISGITSKYCFSSQRLASALDKNLGYLKGRLHIAILCIRLTDCSGRDRDSRKEWSVVVGYGSLRASPSLG